MVSLVISHVTEKSFLDFVAEVASPVFALQREPQARSENELTDPEQKA
jgi:hypothetical protein